MIEILTGFLKMQEIEYKENYPMSRISPMRIGGDARIVITPESKEELVDTVNFLEEIKFRYRIVGRMSNILPSDGGYRGALVRTAEISGFELSDSALNAFSGESAPALISRLAQLGIGGLEEFSGIPGTIGGLVFQNAGAFGREFSDVLISIEAYDKNKKEIRIIDKEQLHFSYRKSSIGEEGLVILSANLSVTKDDPRNIKQKINNFKNVRRDTQPYNLPSLGSTFKRPSVGYASKMIDECGLKGYRVGGAGISNKHAGFIVNSGGATSNDVKTLVELCQGKVLSKFGVSLELEIEYLEN